MKQLLLLTLLLGTLSLLAQEPVADCVGGTQGAYLHGNDIRAYINNSGGLFFDGSHASFETPYGSEAHSIFAQGLWMGAIDQAGGLKVAAQTYGLANNQHDFFPGPLNDQGTIEEDDCRNWDKVWCVMRYQIEAHQADYADNNVIDNPIDEIFAWPALGNPQFEEQNGFALPNSTSGLAPFVDTDQNGVYNPLKGDYPMIAQSVNVPEQICWNVYNDAGGIHSSSQGDVLQMEVQLTSWAFSCTDNEQLNKTLFTSYKIISKGVEPLDSFHVGLWHDFDLGCYTDDYIGHHEASNSVFAYNQDNIDGENGTNCSGGVVSYGENPPVQSVTFLNKSLDYGMYYSNGGIGGVPGATDPNISLEYYYYLTGRWRDGSPLEHGGDGYQEGTFPTNIAFPGDPNDLNEWSALSANIPVGDRRTVSSTFMGMMEPGMVQTLDVAYSFFREEGSNHIENVTAMYTGLEDLQAWYDAAFDGACAASQICEEDCVWPGDLNADGIANYCDLIPLGASLNENGTSRSGPYNWSPHTGTNWTETQLNGANAKHLDANGDAVADASDFALTQQHYGLTVPGFEAEIVVVPSSEQGLYIEPTQGPLEDLTAGQTAFAKIGIEGYEPLRALAFSLQYDTRYFSNIQVFANGFDESAIEYAADHPELGGLHYAHYVLEGNEVITDGTFLNVLIHVNDDLDMEELPSDALVLQFANTKGINELGEDVVVESQNLTVTFEGVTISSTQDLAEGVDVEIFPNPTRNDITVKCILPMMGNIELHSASGQHLHTYAAKGAKQQTISLNDLPTGLYFLQIPTEEGLVVEKIIKK